MLFRSGGLVSAYIARLRRSGDQAAVRSEMSRLQGMLEILYRGPDAPDEVKEALLEMQLEQLEQMSAPARIQPGNVQELAAKIRDELNDYHGDRLTEFQMGLARLESSLPAAVRPGLAGRQPVSGGRQPVQPGRQPGRQTPNPVLQQRSGTRTPATAQNGARPGRGGNIFMPPAGGEMRPFAPNNNRSIFNRERTTGGASRAVGRNEAPAGRNDGPEAGQNDNPAGGGESSGGQN